MAGNFKCVKEYSLDSSQSRYVSFNQRSAWTHDRTLKLNIQESCDIKLYAQLRSECIANKHIFYENLVI